MLVIRCSNIYSVFVYYPWQNTLKNSGASVATPDKVEAVLTKIKLNKNEFDLNAFAGAAVLGRANTAFAALTFVTIQVVVLGTIFVNPLIESITGKSLF